MDFALPNPEELNDGASPSPPTHHERDEAAESLTLSAYRASAVLRDMKAVDNSHEQDGKPLLSLSQLFQQSVQPSSTVPKQQLYTSDTRLSMLATDVSDSSDLSTHYDFDYVGCHCSLDELAAVQCCGASWLPAADCGSKNLFNSKQVINTSSGGSVRLSDIVSFRFAVIGTPLGCGSMSTATAYAIFPSLAVDRSYANRNNVARELHNRADLETYQQSSAPNKRLKKAYRSALDTAIDALLRHPDREVQSQAQQLLPNKPSVLLRSVDTNTTIQLSSILFKAFVRELHKAVVNSQFYPLRALRIYVDMKGNKQALPVTGGTPAAFAATVTVIQRFFSAGTIYVDAAVVTTASVSSTATVPPVDEDQDNSASLKPGDPLTVLMPAQVSRIHAQGSDTRTRAFYHTMCIPDCPGMACRYPSGGLFSHARNYQAGVEHFLNIGKTSPFQEHALAGLLTSTMEHSLISKLVTRPSRSLAPLLKLDNAPFESAKSVRDRMEKEQGNLRARLYSLRDACNGFRQERGFKCDSWIQAVWALVNTCGIPTLGSVPSGQGVSIVVPSTLYAKLGLLIDDMYNGPILQKLQQCTEEHKQNPQQRTIITPQELAIMWAFHDIVRGLLVHGSSLMVSPLAATTLQVKPSPVVAQQQQVAAQVGPAAQVLQVQSYRSVVSNMSRYNLPLWSRGVLDPDITKFQLAGTIASSLSRYHWMRAVTMAPPPFRLALRTAFDVAFNIHVSNTADVIGEIVTHYEQAMCRLVVNYIQNHEIHTNRRVTQDVDLSQEFRLTHQFFDQYLPDFINRSARLEEDIGCIRQIFDPDLLLNPPSKDKCRIPREFRSVLSMVFAAKELVMDNITLAQLHVLADDDQRNWALVLETRKRAITIFPKYFRDNTSFRLFYKRTPPVFMMTAANLHPDADPLVQDMQPTAQINITVLDDHPNLTTTRKMAPTKRDLILSVLLWKRPNGAMDWDSAAKDIRISSFCQETDNATEYIKLYTKERLRDNFRNNCVKIPQGLRKRNPPPVRKVTVDDLHTEFGGVVSANYFATQKAFHLRTDALPDFKEAVGDFVFLESVKQQLTHVTNRAQEARRQLQQHRQSRMPSRASATEASPVPVRVPAPAPAPVPALSPEHSPVVGIVPVPSPSPAPVPSPEAESEVQSAVGIDTDSDSEIESDTKPVAVAARTSNTLSLPEYIVLDDDDDDDEDNEWGTGNAIAPANSPGVASGTMQQVRLSDIDSFFRNSKITVANKTTFLPNLSNTHCTPEEVIDNVEATAILTGNITRTSTPTTLTATTSTTSTPPASPTPVSPTPTTLTETAVVAVAGTAPPPAPPAPPAPPPLSRPPPTTTISGTGNVANTGTKRASTTTTTESAGWINQHQIRSLRTEGRLNDEIINFYIMYAVALLLLIVHMN